VLAVVAVVPVVPVLTGRRRPQKSDEAATVALVSSLRLAAPPSITRAAAVLVRTPPVSPRPAVALAVLAVAATVRLRRMATGRRELMVLVAALVAVSLTADSVLTAATASSSSGTQHRSLT